MRRPPPGLQSHCEGLTTEEDRGFPMGTQNPSVPPRAQARLAEFAIGRSLRRFEHVIEAAIDGKRTHDV